MKAHVIRKPTKADQEACDRYIEEELERQGKAAFMRVFKVFCYVLNRDHKFGFGRLAAVIDGVKSLLEEQDDDPIFWEHLDRVVIDEIKMPFPREKVDLHGNLIE